MFDVDKYNNIFVFGLPSENPPQKKEACQEPEHLTPRK
jgi:hypothetical protein